MWGSKAKHSTVSEFFKGTNIFSQMANSLFGKFNDTLNELFCPEDIKKFKLPKVIVIGNESTGKSSILENITKCQLFPRDGKLCTKCPICVKLNTGPSFYSITYPNGKKQKVNNKNEIYGYIQKYMFDIPGDTILDSEVIVEIVDLDMPVFEFYDLPGIRTYPPETAKMTTKLCYKYLNERNSIVLCVVPATTTRLTSCQSIALISEMKMEHNCILALTMADRLQPENIEELLIKRILKTSDEIDYLNFAGYVAVVNRIHSDKHSLCDHDIIEQKWFQENILLDIPEEYSQFASQIEDNLSITKLILKMDDLYNKYIHSDWKPNILKSLADKKESLDNKYIELGIEITQYSYQEIIKFLNEKIHGEKEYKTTDYVFELATKSNEPYYKDENEDFDDQFLDDEDDDKTTPLMKLFSQYIQTGGTSLNLLFESNKYKYHMAQDLVNKYMSFRSIEFLTDEITNLFDCDDVYKLGRFDLVKNKIIQKYTETFEKLKEDKKDIIEFEFKTFIVSELMYENEVDINVCLRKLFKLHIMSFMTGELCLQELQLDKLLQIEDFVENDQYKQKRDDLKKLIEKTSEHYIKIRSI